jgi:DNA-binding transcriptional LysR family regulator
MALDPWPTLDLRHLVTFRAVARAGSFRAAAQSLGFTQAAVSQQIALLEQRLGERLIERHRGRRGVELTGPGELLLEHAEGILRRVEAARSAFTADAQSVRPLRIASFHSISRRLLPQTVARLLAARPRMRVEIREEQTNEMLLEKLRAGDVDLAFMDFLPPAAEFEAEQVLVDPYVVLAPAGSAVARCDVVTLDQLDELPVLAFSSECASGGRVERFAAELGNRLDVVVRADAGSALHRLVRAGVGYALVPRLVVDPEDETVVAVPVDPRLPKRSIALVTALAREPRPDADAFVLALRQTLAELDLAGRRVA